MTFYDTNIPHPTKDDVIYYLSLWQQSNKYSINEKALNKLFNILCPQNNNIDDILLKVTALNNLYNTNIYDVLPVAQHILELNIDNRLEQEDLNLIEEIQKVTIGGKERNFYSFATKYCSHHKPAVFPIYDKYVDKCLRYFKKFDNFSSFKNEDLKDYKKLKKILLEFQEFYKLHEFNLKQIDQYLWLLGKNYF